MANWSALTIDDLKSVMHGAIVDAAQTSGTDVDDPVPRAIADITARMRAAISGGNQLDVDKTKIPNSLKDLAARMCARLLKQRIQMDLTQDERDQRKEDNAYLDQIAKDKIRFETPDTPGGDAEMQDANAAIEQTTGGNIPDDATDPNQARIATRDTLKGL